MALGKQRINHITETKQRIDDNAGMERCKDAMHCDSTPKTTNMKKCK